MNKTIKLIPQGQEGEIKIDLEISAEEELNVITPEKKYTLKVKTDSQNSGSVINLETNEVNRFFFHKEKENLEIWINGKSYVFKSQDQKSEQTNTRKTHHREFTNKIKAPMPGLILKVLVEEGLNIKANEPLIIMESMKMEMTITAPAGCKILKVNCKEGQLVEMDSVLMELEHIAKPD